MFMLINKITCDVSFANGCFVYILLKHSVGVVYAEEMVMESLTVLRWHV